MKKIKLKKLSELSSKEKLIGILILAGILLTVAAIILIASVSGRRDVEVVELGAVELMESSAEAEGELAPLMRYTQSAKNNVKIEKFLMATGDAVSVGDTVAYVSNEYTDLYLSLLEQKNEAELKVSQGNEGAQALYDSLCDQIDALLATEGVEESMFITADASGKIMRISAKDGAQVKAGEPLFDVVDDTVYLVEFAFETWTRPLPLGTELSLYNADRRLLDFKGEVVRLKERAGRYEYVLKVIGNCEEYFEQYSFVLLLADFGSAEGVKVPRRAVFAEDGESFVYLAKSGKAKKVAVKVLLGTEEHLLISEGLKAGDRVILNTMELEDGDKVKAVIRPF